MKRFKTETIAILLMLAMVSCTARTCQSCNRDWQFQEREYDVKMYSGDSMVFHDEFFGIINQEEHSDGIYYFKGDTLIEVGGNYIITSEK